VIRRTPRLAAALLLTILLAAAGEDAHAHAVLVESTPVDGAALASAPDRVTLQFNEPVRVISLRLVDESGRATPLAPDPETAPDRVAASLPSLSPGSYVVSWRLLSVDGHPVAGTAFFTLGTAQRHVDPGAMARAAEAPAGLRMANLVIRGLTYACALVAAGLALFLILFGRYAA
jgi:copper transport protein